MRAPSRRRLGGDAPFGGSRPARGADESDGTDPCALYDRRLGHAAGALFEAVWGVHDYDARFREVLCNYIKLIGAIGFIGHVATHGVTLSCFAEVPLRPGPEGTPAAERDGGRDGDATAATDSAGPDAEATLVNDVLAQVRSEIKGRSQGGAAEVLQLKVSGRRLAAVAVHVPGSRGTPAPAAAADPAAANLCVMVYDPCGNWRAGPKCGDEDAARREEARFCRTHALGTLKMFFEMVRVRVRRFGPFSPKLSQRYWQDSRGHRPAECPGSPGRTAEEGNCLRPPWDMGAPVRTATLSFDLRKSTFAMEQADDERQFARWLDELARILALIGSQHGAVFDKFTGDGALLHFLDRECRMIYDGRGAAAAAVACACDMQAAMRLHVARLRRFLRIDSKLIGAGIGIDIADAFWSVDQHDNPIVVGRGVVGACRLCAKALAGRVMVTNITCQELDAGTRAGFERVEFESKELTHEMRAVAWRLRKPPARAVAPASSASAVERLCRRVYDASAPA